jgi:hypothetical protein
MKKDTRFFIVATGASLTQDDVNYIKGKGTIIVINNAFKLAPFADILYACDVVWWEAYEKDLINWNGKKMSIFYDQNGCIKWECNTRLNGLGEEVIHTGGNSGYQAINLAYLLGAKEIILLGYDMKQTNGLRHFHGQHKRGLRNNDNYPQWIKHMGILANDLKAKGIKVINCTRSTALECYEKQELQNAC